MDEWGLLQLDYSVVGCIVWCVKAAECGSIPEGYDERVANRGFLATSGNLMALTVGAFLNHCGWNPCLEGLGNGVMILTWPINADQL